MLLLLSAALPLVALGGDPERAPNPEGALPESAPVFSEEAVMNQDEASQDGGLPEAPWALTYADGSGNRTLLKQAAPGAPVLWVYDPVTPAESSSGTYSGGPERQGSLAEEHAVRIWTHALGLTEGLAPAGGGRAMGTGSLTVERSSGAPRRWVLERGASLSAFEAALLALRTLDARGG